MAEQIDILDEKISVLTHSAGENQRRCLSLHGGGPSSKESSAYLSSIFIKNGISFSSFDFSGQGESTGFLAETSLERRINEAVEVIGYLGRPQTLIGTSMGGYVAMKVTERIRIENLVLFCPAAYSRASLSLKFGQAFTEEIRRSKSYLETDAEVLCQAFTGKVLLIYGSDDDVIPREIQSLYERSFQNASSFRSVVLENCPHPIHRWVGSNSETKKKLLDDVEDFVKNSG